MSNWPTWKKILWTPISIIAFAVMFAGFLPLLIVDGFIMFYSNVDRGLSFRYCDYIGENWVHPW